MDKRKISFLLVMTLLFTGTVRVSDSYAFSDINVVNEILKTEPVQTDPVVHSEIVETESVNTEGVHSETVKTEPVN
ncbi:MAG: hypothetical protein K6E98_11355, partial [Lachnospiraceae bacterium]|nr:hypothetical protein [Lachnospiraceae bacterium]